MVSREPELELWSGRCSDMLSEAEEYMYEWGMVGRWSWWFSAVDKGRSAVLAEFQLLGKP